MLLKLGTICPQIGPQSQKLANWASKLLHPNLRSNAPNDLIQDEGPIGCFDVLSFCLFGLFFSPARFEVTELHNDEDDAA